MYFSFVILVPLCFVYLRINLCGKQFTPSNTGLESNTCFPEIGSSFKAAFLKGSLFFFSKKAIEIADKFPEETC